MFDIEAVLAQLDADAEYLDEPVPIVAAIPGGAYTVTLAGDTRLLPVNYTEVVLFSPEAAQRAGLTP